MFSSIHTVEKSDFTKEFGASVKRRRKEMGYSQEYLAERADLHRTYVCDVERGARNLSLQSIAKLARALETSVAALFPAARLVDEALSDTRVDILLVEDNPDDVAMTLRAFKKARFRNQVHVVGDGAEALDYVFSRGKYRQRQPQDSPFVILLDLNLPKISGIEVLRQIRKDKRTRQIPTIILTVSQKSDDITECLRLGATAYIVKPVDFQKLIGVTPLLKLDWALLKPAKGNLRAGRD
jgi:CheY-like chemotaxis protein